MGCSKRIKVSLVSLLGLFTTATSAASYIWKDQESSIIKAYDTEEVIFDYMVIRY